MVMFTRLDRSHDDVIGFAVQDRLTAEELRSIQDHMQEVEQDHGSVRVLARMGELDSVQPRALWEDLKKTPDYARSIDRMAVVGDQQWHELATTFASMVATSRFFLPEREDDAWAWLEERDE
jgi:uncharacterized protein (DUF885 family)